MGGLMLHEAYVTNHVTRINLLASILVLTYLIPMVGAGRFERPTPCAQGRCATRLRYAPTFEASLILDYFPIGHPFRKILRRFRSAKTVVAEADCILRPYD